MINRRILLTFLSVLTIIGLASCSLLDYFDEEITPLGAGIEEVSGELVAAIRQGDVSLVADIIADNTENIADIVNAPIPAGPDAGLRPLMIAARDIDNPELVTLLVSNGADAGLTTEQGWTTLLYALAFNTNDAVTAEVLKADNPNENQKLTLAYKPTDLDLLRLTPLRSQIDTGYLPAGATALILSTFISDTQQALSKIQLLTQSSVVASAIDPVPVPAPLPHAGVAAVGVGEEGIGIDLEAGDANGRKATLYAAVHHDAEVVNVLLGAGAQVTDLVDSLGSTVLMHVVEHGNDVNVIDALVAGGLPVDEENKDGYTGLQWAAQKDVPKSAEFISKLIELNADVNKANTQQEGRTALIFAVQSGNVGAVETLTKTEGIDVEKTDDTGNAALVYAADNAAIAELVQPPSQPPPPPSLTASPTALSFTASETGPKTITVALSDADSWSVSTTTNWITASKNGDALSVTVEAYTGSSDRSGSVSLTPAQSGTNGDPVTLSVTQTSPPSLTLSASQLDFTATATAAQTVTITLVNANSWSVTTSDGWITADASSTVDNTLEVTVTENAGTSERRGSVSLIPTQGGTNGTSVSLSVIQAVVVPSLTLSATSLSFTASETAAQEVTITLFNGADNWSVGEITYTEEGDGWITADKNDDALSVTVSAHTGTDERSGNVVLIPAQDDTPGTSVSLSVTQSGTVAVLPPSLTVPEASLSLSFTATATDAQTVTITLVNANSWSVAASDSWIQTSVEDVNAPNTLSVTVSAHTGTDERSGHVVLTPAQDGTTGTSVSLSVTQSGTVAVVPPSLTVPESSLSLSFTATGVAQTVTITLVNANSWSVGASDSWIQTSVEDVNAPNTLSVTVSAHTGTDERSGNVVLTPAQDGTPGTSVSLSVTQSGTVAVVPPSLTLLPTSLSFTATGVAQTVTITLVNANSWSVGAVDPPNSWLSASKSGNVLTVGVDENTGTTELLGSVSLIPAQDGTPGEAVSLSVTQSGAVAVVPPSLTVPEASLSLSFTATGVAQTVTITLVNANSWSVGASDSWIQTSVEDVNAPNTLSVTVSAHTGTDERSGNVVLTPAQDGTPGTSVSLSVTQSGTVAVVPPSLTVPESSLSLSFTATGVAQTVTITLVNANSWSVGASDSWIQTSVEDVNAPNTLSVTVSAHTGTDERSGHVVLTPAQDGTPGTSVSLSVTQSGTVAPLPPSLTVPEASLSLSFTATGVAQTVTITLVNANSWSVGASDSWIQTSVDAVNAPNTLSVTVSAHTGTDERSGNVVLTPAQDGTPGTSVSLSVTQSGTVAVVPPSLTVPESSLSLSFTATGVAQTVTITLVNANSWSVGASDSWIQTSVEDVNAPNTLSVTVSAHTGTDERSGNVVLTPAQDGTPGTSVSLSVTQSGTVAVVPPSLTVPESSLSLSFTATGVAQTVTITLVNANSWSVGASDSWIQTSVEDVNAPNTLSVTVSAHTGTDERSGHVVLTPAQDGTPGTSVSLSVTQSGAVAVVPPSLTVPDLLTFTKLFGFKNVPVTLTNEATSWSVGAVAPLGGWLSASKSGDALQLTLLANLGPTRSGSVSLIPAKDGAPGPAVSLSVTQSGTVAPLPPSLTVPEASLSFTATGVAQTVTITLVNANSWSVGAVDPPNSWLSASKSGNVLTVGVDENTGTTELLGSVSLIPAQDGTPGEAVSLSVTQSGAVAVVPPSLTVPEASLSLSFTATGVAQTVTITLVNANSWSVGAVDPPNSWLSASKSGNVLTVGVDENTGTTELLGSVSLIPAQDGTPGEAVSLSVTQSGTVAVVPPSLTLLPTSLSFTATGVAQTVTITLVNANSWSVGAVDPPNSWLSASKSGNVLTVGVDENTGTTELLGSVSLIPAQDGTPGEAVSLSVTQSGAVAVVPPSLTVPDLLTFTKLFGFKNVPVTLTNEATSWSVGAVAPLGGWLSASKSGDALQLTLLANLGPTRSGSVSLIPAKDGAPGPAVSLSVTQSGTVAPLPPSLTVPESSLSLSFTATGVAQTVTITLVNANSWSVGASDSWIQTSVEDVNAPNTLSVTVSAHTGTDERSGNVVLTPAQDGTPGTSVSLSVTQSGTVAVVPPSLTVPDLLTFTKLFGFKNVPVTLTNEATSWSVGAVAPLGGWLSASKSGDALQLTLLANLGPTRSGSVSLIPAKDGAPGPAVSLSVTQSGTVAPLPPSLTVPEASLSLSFTATATDAQTVTITLVNANSWSVGAVESSDSWIQTSVEDVNAPNTLSVTVSAHTGTDERSGNVVLIPAQDGTPGTSVSLSVTQSGAVAVVPPSLTVPDLLTFTKLFGFKNVPVTLTNEATSWSVGAVAPLGGWLSASKSGDVLQLVLLANLGPTRSGSVSLIPAKDGAPGPAVSLSVTQSGTVAPLPPSLTVPEASLSFTATGVAQTVTITLVNANSWSVGAVEPPNSWLSASKSGNVLTVGVDENTGTTELLGSVSLIPAQDGTPGEAVSLSVTQSGAVAVVPPSLTVPEASLSFTATGVAQTVTITLVNANSWSVGAVDPPNSWLSASKSGNVLTVGVDENTGTTELLGSVSLIPAQDGTPGEAVSLSVTQSGAVAIGLSVEQITFASGSNAHDVTVNLGNAAGSWSVGTPTYTDADGWITVTKNSNTLTVEVTANASDARRSGSVDVDLGGSTKTLSISQVAAPSFGITNRGLGFTFSYDQTSRQYRTLEDIKNIDELTIDPASIPDWLRASVTPGNNVQANPLLSHVTSESRSANLRVIGTKTGVTGTNGASTVETFRVAQNGRPISLQPGIALYESTVNVPATASTSKSVQVIVGGADTWSVGTPSETWLTAPRGTGDDADKILISVLTANEGTSERSATVTISATNTNGTTTKTLTITQGVNDPAIVLNPDELTFGPTDDASQRVAVTVQYSTRGFSATKPQDARWLTLSSDRTGIDVNVSTYAETSDRSTTVTVRSYGSPTDTRTFTVTQTGVLPVLRFDNPPSTIRNTAGYLTFTAYMDYATSWTSSVVYKDAADNVVTDSWLSLSSHTVSGVPRQALNFRGAFGADYSANTGAQRSATVTVTATNPQKSVSETFTVVQRAGN